MSGTADLHAQLLEQRDDLGLWGVYGDALLSQDDPRGPLVTMMLEREQRPTPKLFAAEVAYRAKHGKKLVPSEFHRHLDAISWRRGFAHGIPLVSPEMLAQAGSPSLAFVESARIEMRSLQWQDWVAALGGLTLPWRRVRITVEYPDEDEELDLAPWTASMPALEHLAIEFRDGPGRPVFGSVEAPRLRHLAIDNAVEVMGLEDAALPALEELRCLATTPVGDALWSSALFRRLKQVVVSDVTGLPRTGPTIVSHVRVEPDYYDEQTQDAFFVVRQLVDASLVAECARDIKGFYSLSVVVGHVLAGDDSLTAVRLCGIGENDELAPYGLATALKTNLAPDTPIALFHTSAVTGTARGLALDATMSRRSLHRSRSAEILRALLDQPAGHDPGIDVLDDVREALECGTVTVVVGGHRARDVLVDIDPGTRGPLPEVDEDFETPVPEHEVELYEQPAPAVVAIADEEVVEPIEQEVVYEAELADADESEDENLRTDGLPDGRDAWLRLLSTWSERERDPDDEYAERFPDPDEERIDFESVPSADTKCQACEQAAALLYPCVWCGGPHCTSCSTKVESGGVWCNQCIIDLAKSRTSGEGSEAVLYNDEVFDNELADQLAPAPVDDDEWI